MQTTDEPSIAPPPIDDQPWEPFPEIDLRQLLRMTDDTGMFQHAVYGMPDPNHGYCIDDNARAVIAALLYAQLRGYDERVVPLHRYLTFLAYAYNDQTQSFRNFMGYDRRWLEDAGSQDSQGRTIWTLGLTVRLAPQEGIHGLARNLLHKGLPAIEKFGFIRSWAFALIGLDEYLHVEPADDYALRLRDTFAQRLFDAYQKHTTDEWPWWEDEVTYDNAKLSHALLVSGRAMGRPDMVEAGLRSLRWLIEVQTVEDEQGGHLSIIGNDGWLRRDGHHARFDQQPLEAYAMVHACLTAAETSGDSGWADHAWRCFEWFRGRNDLNIPLHNPNTGGCHDGLRPDGINQNQGAESVLAYLLSVLELHRYREGRTGRIRVRSQATLGYGVVGGSSLAETCLEQCAQIEGLEPLSIWSPTSEEAQRLGTSRGIAVSDSLQEMLKDPRLQIVHVAGVPSERAEVVLQALAAGKHVICDAPMATDPVDAQRMIQAAAQRDRCLSVGFLMRYGPLAEPIREIIRSGLLGTPLRGNLVGHVGQGAASAAWFWNEEQGGGPYLTLAAPAFDLIQYWLGSAAQVLSAHRFRPAGSDEVDQVLCEVRHGDRTTVSHYHALGPAVPGFTPAFRVHFERGELSVEGEASTEVTIRAGLLGDDARRLLSLLPADEAQREPAGDGVVRIRWAAAQGPEAVHAAAAKAWLEDVVTAARDRAHRPRVTAEDGLSALAIATEAKRIARGSMP